MKKKEIRLPTILGLVVAIAGLVTGVVLLRLQLKTAALAAAEETPNKVAVSNISDSSFTVSWSTERAAPGFVQYSEKATDPDLVVSDERDQLNGAVGSYLTHFVTIKGLKPSTEYVFRLGSGKHLYDQGNGLYTVTTGAQLANPPPADVAYGQVMTQSGDPGDGAVVYLQIPGASLQSALVKSSGSYVVPLSTIRTNDLSKFITYDKEKTAINVSVMRGPLEDTLVTTSTATHAPIPDIILGKGGRLEQSGSNVDTSVSKFSNNILGPAIEASGGAILTILTPKFGEEVNSARPEIIGQAPANTEVTVEVHSTQVVTGTTKSDQNGKFTFSVPSDLSAGEHSVTISSVVDGVVKKVTRNFVVLAAGESFNPAFSSSPSATLAPTIKPTATPKPSPTRQPSPTPTRGPSPLPTPTGVRPSPTVVVATPSPTPKPVVIEMPASGNDEPTVLVLGIGIGLIISGLWWYRYSL